MNSSAAIPPSRTPHAFDAWLPRGDGFRFPCASAPLAPSSAWDALADARTPRASWLQPCPGPGALGHPYFFTRLLFPPQQTFALLHERNSSLTDAPWRIWLDRAARDAARLDEFSAISWLELRSYLLNTLLRDTDSMSMANSLEVRVPFLDHPLVEFVLGLPASAKRRAGQSKPLLVEALGDLLPAEVAAQPKRTFTFPWDAWLRDALRERVAESLEHLSPAVAAVLEPENVLEMWNDFFGRAHQLVAPLEFVRAE